MLNKLLTQVMNEAVVHLGVDTSSSLRLRMEMLVSRFFIHVPSWFHVTRARQVLAIIIGYIFCFKTLHNFHQHSYRVSGIFQMKAYMHLV